MNLAMLISDTLRYGPSAIVAHADLELRKAIVAWQTRKIPRSPPGTITFYRVSDEPKDGARR